MIVEASLWLTSILFFSVGFAVAFSRGVRGRGYIFIFVITVLFLLFGVFASDMALKYAKPGNFDDLGYSQKEQMTEQIKGTTIFIVGLIGLVILTQFRSIRTNELGYAFGIGGTVQTISGLIAMVAGEAVELKFFVSLVGLVLLTYLFYKYRDFLMGKEVKQV
jgi:hypothetical protein